MNYKCQVFTPNEFVEMMLDLADYKKNLYGKKVLENSFGNGNFLVEIVERYIIDAINNKLDDDLIKNGLQDDIYGFEIDKTRLDECINRLNQVTLKYGIDNVNFKHIVLKDYLQTETIKFDFIIGNPPYISHREMNEELRMWLKEKYISCKKGKFDYCYPFIEKSIDDLKENGILTYIIPASIFKNVFANEIRTKLYTNGLNIIVDNFKGKVFKNAIISPSIFVLKKNYSGEIQYINLKENKKTYLNRDKLVENKKWIFTSYVNNNLIKLGDNFIIGNSIATLANDVFLIKNITKEDEIYFYIGDNKIEKEFTKKAFSPHSLCGGKIEYIIFPYYYEKGILCRYHEDDIKKKYPFAYRYLESKRDLLDKRDKDEKAKWFEYGRNQALKNMNKPKAMLSILVTNGVNIHYLNEDEIPYSGIYISLKNLEEYYMLRNILVNEDFLNYLKSIGIKSSGESYRVTSSDVKKYKYKEE